MKDYDKVVMSEFTRGTPLGVAMVKAAYDIGYDFFPNLYREEVQTTIRKTDIEFLMGYISFYLVNDGFEALQEFAGAQSCPNFPDDNTTFLLRCLDNTLTGEMKTLSNDCYRSLDNGVVDGYMDTMRDIINGLKPIGRYDLCGGVAIEVYHIDHNREEVLASLVSDNEIEAPDKLYPPMWCKIRKGANIGNEDGRGEGFLYGKVSVPFSQTIN